MARRSWFCDGIAAVAGLPTGRPWDPAILHPGSVGSPRYARDWACAPHPSIADRDDNEIERIHTPAGEHPQRLESIACASEDAVVSSMLSKRVSP